MLGDMEVIGSCPPHLLVTMVRLLEHGLVDVDRSSRIASRPTVSRRFALMDNRTASRKSFSSTRTSSVVGHARWPTAFVTITIKVDSRSQRC
jgi:hypothetical protein